MKAFILLLICGVVIIDCTLIQKINHSLNKQHNTQQYKIAHSSIQIPNQHHYLSSRVHKDNQNNSQTHFKTQNHNQVVELLSLAVNTGMTIYDKFFKDKNNNNQPQQQSKYEEQIITQTLSDLPNPNMAAATLLEKGDCPSGQGWHLKTKKCVKCTTPNQLPVQDSLTGQLYCSFISPFVPVSVVLGANQKQCIQPSMYNKQQKSCYTCPSNFILDADLGSKNLFCWCDSPYIFKQIKGVKSCEPAQKSKEVIKNVSTNSNNKNASISNCLENYIQKVDNVTKKSVCQCLSPDFQILQATGNKKCLKHICPKGGLYDTTLKQCKYCSQPNFVTKINDNTKKVQCLCELPFKIKNVGKVQKCEK